MEYKRRGNPNWGRNANDPTTLMMPAGPTEFEPMVKRLKLRSQRQIERSQKLRDWSYAHRNQRYVPEALLKTWGIYVDVNV